jgi:CubicO group peptidase (beta-lactamase class C family)
MEFLHERIFEPLGMDTVVDIDRGTLGPDDAVGYRRFALGPLRPAPKEGKGWLFAAGPLAMTAEDLARWNLALIEGKIPGHEVFAEISRDTVLDNGTSSGYGLGLGIARIDDRRVVGHGGEVSGFTAANRIYPEDRVAVVVLANQDAVTATGSITRKIVDLLFREESEEDDALLTRVGEILRNLGKGKLDRSLFTPNANSYFSETALEDIRSGLKGLRSPKTIDQIRKSQRGGLTTRVYSAHFKKKSLEIVTRVTPDGKFEQYTISSE